MNDKSSAIICPNERGDAFNPPCPKFQHQPPVAGASVQHGLSAAIHVFALHMHRRAADKRHSLSTSGDRMPLVTLTVRKPKSSAFKTTVLDAVHAALVSSGVPVTDKFQRVIELEADDFRFDPNYPDLQSDRTDDFALIEILWSVGRSVKVKKKLLEELMGTLARAGLNPENVMVCFKETSWENWSFGGGRLIHT
ncbi:MAG: tautomerase family protein [Polaromonas sp.]